jgi:hypothetical protein
VWGGHSCPPKASPRKPPPREEHRTSSSSPRKQSTPTSKAADRIVRPTWGCSHPARPSHSTVITPQFGFPRTEVHSCNLDWQGPASMLRRTAIALLLAVISPYLLACIPPGKESALPACCRRDGKHHCAKMASFLTQEQGQERGKAPSLRAAGEPCPYRTTISVPTAPRVLAPPPSRAFFAGVASHPALTVQTVLAARVSELRSDLKRGPPHVRS